MQQQTYIHIHHFTLTRDNRPMIVAPASRLFSTSSFTAVANVNTTWPEQILWTVDASISWMFPDALRDASSSICNVFNYLNIRQIYQLSHMHNTTCYVSCNLVNRCKTALNIAPFDRAQMSLLLTFNSNYCKYVPILHHFWSIATYWVEIADFNLPTSIIAPQLGWPVGISPRSLASENVPGLS